ncbi:MAG: thymidine phosphorylase [Acidimicrobiia bacterium]|nr:thymidine phosphorylase [Acidimicrobiia bacterium]MDH4308198.1 thymidine phosphorylase [Acidimicrobiia bacterium]MDH5295022.1 thymidine phosphorylase [Acidimicrobiia bacterium]
MPTATELIERKRDRGRLTDDEIAWLIRGYTGGSVTDYQMAAMAMAVFLNGLDDAELAAWTRSMLHSGEVLDFSDIPIPKVDKHSTGGVGDKVSIPLGPMVAACGVAIPMMSGRGLGHTGGTLDKLESIPGFTTGLDPARFRSVLESCGLVLAGQSETLVPADRKLYALRDATGTVPSIPLISSSIMSKKLAEGLNGLVLDVKFGSGAFMKEIERARELATTMVGIGAANGVETVALLTSMDAPLGLEIGNANEIRESLDVLEGGGPADLVEVTLALGAEMLVLGGVSKDTADARVRLEATRTSGAAIELFAKVIEAQDGDPRVIEDRSLLPSAPKSHEIAADTDGFLSGCDSLKIGVAGMRLGAGRERKEDTIDPGVGITLHAKPGDRVAVGQPLATLSYRHTARLQEALRVIDGAWEITQTAPSPVPLIADKITA